MSFLVMSTSAVSRAPAAALILVLTILAGVTSDDALGASATIEIETGPVSASRRVLARPGSGATFSDCADGDACPAMTVVPATEGAEIGSPLSEADRQDDEFLRAVTLPMFAIGTTEVTVGEYKLCMADGGCRSPEWLEPGSTHNIETGGSRYYGNLGGLLTGANQPIVGVSFDDAVAYSAWLSRRTGRPYRLPSEAEWEYAARAGSRTAYWWGDEISGPGEAHANCRGCGSRWDGKGAAPVQSFAPNAWGLYEVHGNVWEWVADVYCDDVATAPRGAAPQDGSACTMVDKRTPNGLRVLRGGSSFYEAGLARSAVRARNRADFRNFSVGFRVARSLER